PTCFLTPLIVNPTGDQAAPPGRRGARPCARRELRRPAGRPALLTEDRGAVERRPGAGAAGVERDRADVGAKVANPSGAGAELVDAEADERWHQRRIGGRFPPPPNRVPAACPAWHGSANPPRP